MVGLLKSIKHGIDWLWWHTKSSEERKGSDAMHDPVIT
jgi:hypothetical protein